MVDLRSDTVNRDCGRAGKPSQQKLIYIPVDLVYDRVQEQKEGEQSNLLNQQKMKGAEGKRCPELQQNKQKVGSESDNGQYGRRADNTDCAVAQQKQGYGQERVTNGLEHLHKPKEHKLLSGAYDRGKDAARKRDHHIESHDPQQGFCQMQFLRRQLCAQNQVRVYCKRSADNPSQQGKEAEDDQTEEKV